MIGTSSGLTPESQLRRTGSLPGLRRQRNVPHLVGPLASFSSTGCSVRDHLTTLIDEVSSRICSC
jgi:hypothetical protein